MVYTEHDEKFYALDSQVIYIYIYLYTTVELYVSVISVLQRSVCVTVEQRS